MPVPKRKRSRARRDSRKANWGIKPAALAACANCQSPLATHKVCPTCGFYKGRKVMTTKLDRALKRSEVLKTQVTRSGTQASDASTEPTGK